MIGQHIQPMSNGQLVKYQVDLKGKIKRADNGYLYWMKELWQELLTKTEAEMKSRGMITTIKFQ